MKRILFFLLFPLVTLASCTSVKNMTFAGGADLIMSVTDYPEFTISRGDELSINVSALDTRAAEPFNSTHTYFVGKSGTLKLPIIDTILVLGLTLDEMKEIILEQLSDKLIDPFVQISFVNASISVLGEVKSPQQLHVSRPVTIFEAIGAANGLTKNACYTEVEVLRAVDHEVRKSVVDLTSSEIVQSPCYYLQKGDVVNVRPLHPVFSR